MIWKIMGMIDIVSAVVIWYFVGLTWWDWILIIPLLFKGLGSLF